MEAWTMLDKWTFIRSLYIFPLSFSFPHHTFPIFILSDLYAMSCLFEWTNWDRGRGRELSRNLWACFMWSDLEGSPSIPIGSDIFLELLPAAPSSSHNDPTQYSIVSHIRIRHAYYEY